MAYTPTEWKNGDVITAEKLNNIEDGVEEALECNPHLYFEGTVSGSNVTPTSKWNYTAAEVKEMVLTNKIIPHIGAYLTSQGGSPEHPIVLTNYYEMLISVINEAYINVQFAFGYPNDYPYIILEDGSVDTDE